MTHSTISLGLGLGCGKSATSSGGGGLFAPVITSSAATNIVSNGATLNGTLVSTGGSDPTVTVYWGTVDRGEVSYGWNGGSYPFGTQSAGALARTISGQASATTFYYRFKAVNSAGTAWTEAQSFQTAAPAISIELNDTEANITGASHTGDATGTIAYGTDTDAIYVHRGDGWWDKYAKNGTV